MTEELLTLVSSALFGTPCDTEATDELIKEAEKQAVSGLVRKDYRLVARNMRVVYEHLALHTLLTRSGIPYVILKGYASAAYYPDPDKRTLGDVDFLVYEKDIGRAGKVLLQAGYGLTDKLGAHHAGFRHNGVHLEMHKAINGIPDNAAGDAARQYMASVIADALLTPVRDGYMMLPSPFHHGLISLLHMAKHMTSSGMGLRHLCDWAVFVDRIDDFPGMFREAFEDIGIWEFAKQITAVCCRYLKLPEQNWTGRYPDSRLEEIMKDILLSGNFGQKKDTPYEGVLLTSPCDTGGAGHDSNAVSAVRNIAEMAQSTYPACARHPVWLPFGFIAVCFRYAWRVMTGKRKMFTRNTFAEASRRKKLYDGFRLFEKR